MTDPSHAELRTRLGAYVLGHLSAEESRELETHLAGCADCRADLEELRPVAAALADLRHAPAVAPDSEPAPPAELGDRVLAAVSRATDDRRGDDRRGDDRRGGGQAGPRRRWVLPTALAGAAAAASIVTAVVVVNVVSPDAVPRPVALEMVDVRVDEPGVRASAGLVNHTWGVEVRLTASGFTSGGRYRVNVVGDGGQRYPAGEFVGTGSREMVCNLNSSVLRDRAGGFEVLDAAGEVLVTSDFD